MYTHMFLGLIAIEKYAERHMSHATRLSSSRIVLDVSHFRMRLFRL